MLDNVEHQPLLLSSADCFRLVPFAASSPPDPTRRMLCRRVWREKRGGSLSTQWILARPLANREVSGQLQEWASFFRFFSDCLSEHRISLSANLTRWENWGVRRYSLLFSSAACEKCGMSRRGYPVRLVYPHRIIDKIRGCISSVSTQSQCSPRRVVAGCPLLLRSTA